MIGSGERDVEAFREEWRSHIFLRRFTFFGGVFPYSLGWRCLFDDIFPVRFLFPGPLDLLEYFPATLPLLVLESLLPDAFA